MEIGAEVLNVQCDVIREGKCLCLTNVLTQYLSLSLSSGMTN